MSTPTENQPSAPETGDDRSQRKTLEGTVLSDKMDKTRVIRVVRRFRHQLYGKVLTRYTKVHAHDEKNETRTGDRVAVMSTRPLSKLKRWRIVQVLEKAPVSADMMAVTGEDDVKLKGKTQ
jgi:small subunit ribosomal protein S17